MRSQRLPSIGLFRLLAAAVLVFSALTSCIEEECITVVVTNGSVEAVEVFATECWALKVTVEPGETRNIFALPGETVTAEGKTTGIMYSHIFRKEYEIWEINWPDAG